jgi:hypothetical protein
MENKGKNKGKNKGHDNLIPCKPGETANPNGRPKGRRNFSTIFYDALENLAKKNNMEPDQLETEIVEKALLSARKGDARFYKDLMDRVHGTAIQRQDVMSGGKPIPLMHNVFTNNQSQEDSSTD